MKCLCANRIAPDWSSRHKNCMQKILFLRMTKILRLRTCEAVVQKQKNTPKINGCNWAGSCSSHALCLRCIVSSSCIIVRLYSFCKAFQHLLDEDYMLD